MTKTKYPLVKPAKFRSAATRLNETGAYSRAMQCMAELGEASVDDETLAACDRILDRVIDLGVAVARCDLHRRMGVAAKTTRKGE